MNAYAPVAQLDRVTDYESVGFGVAILEAGHAGAMLVHGIEIDGLNEHIVSLRLGFAQNSASGIDDLAVSEKEQIVHTAEDIGCGDEHIVLAGASTDPLPVRAMPRA